MSTQIELRASISNTLADLLEGYFHESETAAWGILQREPGSPFELFGFFPDKTTAEQELSDLQKIFPDLPDDFLCNEIEDAHWQNAYKEYIQPWSDRTLYWIPLWEREHVCPPAGAATVYLDAGMAFGTGSHETTRLCARRLLDFREARAQSPEQALILDAGCGSGVLALSAAALGYKCIYAFDNDPEAIAVCHENRRQNEHLLTDPAFAVADLPSGLLGRKADLLLANIQTDVLIPFSDVIILSIAKGGVLALSGILEKELEQVKTHYQSRFADLRPEDAVEIDSRTDGEWSDLQISLRETDPSLH